ncbi:unnamed protein product [Schistosoma margrebowiei]|uniref:IST1 homolog n=1 Tax=Schistosoma margrebowiei TaxID=48269 RepID=A0A183M4T2_9TREM|nr:unnamed protein product [Schistosoma margrebowiei]
MSVSHLIYKELLNIRLCIQRLEYVQKKKSEISKGIRREIADLLKDGKVDRARIKVEQIIRDDYYTMFNASLETPIATILWSKSRIKNEIPELEIVGQQLAIKFGRNYVRECCEKANMVNRTVMTKLNSIVPGANLVEMYLVSYFFQQPRPFDLPFRCYPSRSAKIRTKCAIQFFNLYSIGDECFYLNDSIFNRIQTYAHYKILVPADTEKYGPYKLRYYRRDKKGIESTTSVNQWSLQHNL